MLRKLRIEPLILTVFVGLAQMPVQALTNSEKLTNVADARNRDAFQTALKRMGRNPKWAEQKLKTLPFPSAKAYLAYLYFTAKVVVPNRSKKVDKLMNDAIAEVDDKFALVDIDSAQHYHYANVSLLLRHLRFITDADSANVAVPASIFKNYPVAAFDAFTSYWGSSRDAGLNIDFDPKEDICMIPAVSQFERILDEIFGNPAPDLSGTIQHMYYRNHYLSTMKASIAPRIFLARINKGEKKIDLELGDFMRYWSNQELFNKVKYEDWLRATKRAALALVKHYRQHFGMTEHDAQICGKAAIAEINTAYLSEYSPSSLKEATSNYVYGIFSKNGLDLKQMLVELKGRSLTKDELGEALRLAILNNGSIDVVQWLVTRGAPLTGGREPALFSAARRPEVIDLLLKAGANVNETNVLGKTALFQAVQFNSLGSVEKLCAAGADIQHSMKSLDVNENSELKYNPDYNYTVGGRTPLMYATAFAGFPVIRYLLDNGADKKAVDSSGADARKYLADNKLVSKVERADLAKMLQ